MMRRVCLLTLVALVLGGCRDWGKFSENFDAGLGGGGGSMGGGSATGGGSSTGGGSGGGTGGGVSTGGGSATGGGTGGGGGSSLDAGACDSRGESVCPSGALFCDGFNTTPLDSAWTLDQMNGTATSGDACVYGGARALHCQLNAVGAGVGAHAYVTEADSGTPLPGNQFIRAMIRLDSPAPSPSVKLITVRQGTPGTSFVQLSYASGVINLGAVGGAVPATTAAFPLDQWVCVEWQLDEGSPGTTKVWLNDSSTTAIEGTLGVSELRSVTVGAQLGDHAGDAAAATNAFIDEVVVSGSRIGCP